jgi:NAD(P)-dependent dehydrogenase (short-subunit alcohol dehydrogenase family)
MRCVEEITAAQGPISACIHAAAPKLARKPMLSLTSEEFQSPLSVALVGAFTLAKAALPHMTDGSVFIGITTAALEHNSRPEKMGSYVPSKNALRGLLRVLTEEMRSPRKIRVNAVAPNFLAGGLNSDLPQGILDFLGKKIGAETPQDVAEIVVRLCSEEHAFPTGTSVSVSTGKPSSL